MPPQSSHFRSKSRQPVTLHFDLSHCPAGVEYTLRSSGIHYRLQRHTAETFAAHREKNAALALIPETHRHKVTHFVENVALPSDAVGWHWVSRPAIDSFHSLPEMALIFVHVPLKSWRRALRLRARRGLKVGVPASLASLGVHSIPEETLATVMDDVWALKTPMDTVKAIVSSHPDLSSLNPDVAAIALAHIEDAANGSDLYTYIRSHRCTFYTKKFCTLPDGTVIQPDASLTDKDGQPIDWPTGPDGSTPAIPRFQLSEDIVGTDSTPGNALPVVQKAIRSVADDPDLNGQKWNAQQGITTVRQVGASSGITARTAAQPMDGEASWAVSFQTSQYGVSVDANSLTFDNSTNAFSIRVKNVANRGLAVWTQFFDEAGNAIPIAPGSDESRTFLETMGSGNVICGIPVWQDYETFSFTYPTEAVSANLLLGGLGYGEGDVKIYGPGEAYTILVNYTVPFFLVALGVGLQSTAFYMQWVKPNMGKVVAVGMAGLLGGAAAGAQVADPAEVLTASAQIGIGLILSGLPELAALIFGYTSGQALLDAVPFVGTAFQIASLAMGASGLIATTVECAQSPCIYVVEIKRSMNVAVTVLPDPLHGTNSQPPIWPDVSTSYEIILQYQGGTSFTSPGTMPAVHDAPINVTFPQVPVAPGDFLQVTANIYSSSGWLAGKWSSGWIPAAPGENATLALKGSIIEALVPLTSTTLYSHYQKLMFDAGAGKHLWQSSPAPSAVVSDLSSSDVGNNLAKCVNITLNNNAYAAGYAWKASGQDLPLDNNNDPLETQMFAFQSISVLAQPQSGIKEPSRGFTQQPYIVYDQFGPPPLFALDGANGQLLDQGTIPDAVKQAFASAGANYTLASDAVVTVVTAGSEWYIGPSGNPLYDLKLTTSEGSSIISVGAYAGTFLFSIPDSFAADLDAGNVSDGLKDAFTKASVSYALPDGVGAFVKTTETEWYLGPQGGPYLYDLKRAVDTSIQVFRYPAPAFSTRNFYLDSRPNTDQVFYLRQVELDQSNGFDYDIGTGWGKFAAVDVSGMTVHPNGYVLAVDYANSKLQVLDLPSAAGPDADTPTALLLSGQGTREGLMSGPVAMTVTPDGRVLVLEQGNARIQAFDTLGNPVQCFAGTLSFPLDAKFQKELDAGAMSADFQQAYQLKVKPQLARCAELTPDCSAALDAGGTVSQEIVQQFAQGGITLSASSAVSVTAAGTFWLITDPDSLLVFDVRLDGGAQEIDVFHAATFVVTITAAGSEWLVRDKTNSLTFNISGPSNGSNLTAQQLVATMNLHDPPTATVQYLDVAVESKSFIYVLSYAPPGSSRADYHLDIYNPDGSFLARTPPDGGSDGVNGARLTVDQWRNLYTLNYEYILGPSSRTEPSVSTWIPSTPPGSK